jgi:hypothetical protein
MDSFHSRGFNSFKFSTNLELPNLKKEFSKRSRIRVNAGIVFLLFLTGISIHLLQLGGTVCLQIPGPSAGGENCAIPENGYQEHHRHRKGDWSAPAAGI